MLARSHDLIGFAADNLYHSSVSFSRSIASRSMASTSALAGLVIASFGVGLQWIRLFQGGDISEPLRVPQFVCGPCPPRLEDTSPERRLFFLELATSPVFWLELGIGYVVGLHVIVGLLLCRYGRRRCCTSASGRRGLRARIEGAVPARHALAGDVRVGPRVAPRAIALEPSH